MLWERRVNQRFLAVQGQAFLFIGEAYGQRVIFTQRKNGYEGC